MKQKWVKMYMDIAQRIAKESHGVRLKVGAVFVSPEGVMSTGINGMPAGGSNVCEHKEYMDPGAGGWLDPETIEAQWPYEEDELSVTGAKKRCKLVTKDECSHAEENLFAKLMRQGVSTVGGRIFLTHAPCIHCAKIIVGSGVTHVHYKSDYRSNAGKDWLITNGVDVTKEY